MISLLFSILVLSLVISLATLGFRLITSKGMILYFLREPFDKVELKRNRVITLRRQASNYERAGRSKDAEKTYEQLIEIGEDIKRSDIVIYIGKPIITCVTCMASVHTLIWYPFLNGGYDEYLVLVMLMVAFINSLLYSIYKK